MKVGDTIASCYRLEAIVGEGGMGSVYKASDIGQNRLVAIKVLKPISPDADAQKKFLKHFRKEAKLLKKLTHKRLVEVYDSFDHGADACIVMEFASGLTLADKMAAQTGPLKAELVASYAGQLLELLEYLHGQSPPVLVRDIKPQNVIVDSSDQLKVVDFGIAREVEPGGKTSTSLRGFGSPGFAPPEQYGYASTDERSDLYSLGATLYFLLTKVEPPDAIALATGQAKLEKISKYNSFVSTDLAKLVHQLMALNPFERPKSAAMARAMLAPTSVPITKPLPPSNQSPKQSESSSGSVWVVVGILFLTFLVFATPPSGKQSSTQNAPKTEIAPKADASKSTPAPIQAPPPVASVTPTPKTVVKPIAIKLPNTLPKPLPPEKRRAVAKHAEPPEMIQAYYGLIEKDEFDDAYALRSSRSQGITTLSEFRNTWKPNRAIKILDRKVVSNDGYTAQVELNILFEEENGELAYIALIDMVFENGSWRYDGGDFKVKEPTKQISASMPLDQDHTKNAQHKKSSEPWHQLRIGMTEEAVESLMGHPDTASEISWEYGPGVMPPNVSFFSGRVSGWSKPNSLKLSPSTVASKPWNQLRIDMTEEQVESLMGHPDTVSSISWEYGPGVMPPNVSFFSGRVSGWSKPNSLKLSPSTVASKPWNQLRIDMTEEQVESLMGHPDTASSISWEYGPGVMPPNVSFFSGRVSGWNKP